MPEKAIGQEPVALHSIRIVEQYVIMDAVPFWYSSKEHFWTLDTNARFIINQFPATNATRHPSSLNKPSVCSTQACCATISAICAWTLSDWCIELTWPSSP